MNGTLGKISIGDCLGKDYMLISKRTTFERVSFLLDSGMTIICDLTDRDGKIGESLVNIDNQFVVTTKGGIKRELSDRYLYNLIYNHVKEYYSLQEHDEYFEKIEVI